MRLKTQRKVIYATMGLTVLALVGGFAAAALTGPGSTSNQNGFSFSAPGNTIYAGTIPTEQLAYVSLPTCTVGEGSFAAASHATSASVYVNGEVGCVTGTPNWFENFTFTSNAVGTATTPSDTFAITCGSYPTSTVTISYSGLSAPNTVSTTIYYDAGASPASVACAITVNGS